MAPSGGSNVTLFTHKVSPFAHRVQIAMVEKGIPFKPVYVDLTNKPKELLEANPIYGKVPTLVHDGNPVCESLVILEYLDEAWPETKSLLPKDAVAKSKARFWADYIYKGLAGILKMLLENLTTPAAMAEMSKFFKTIEDAMTEYSADGPYFTGDEFGYLDIVLSPLATWVPLMKIQMDAALPGPDQSPRLNMCIKAIKEQKAYKEVIPSDEEFLEVSAKIIRYTMMRAEAAAAAAAAATAAANGK